MFQSKTATILAGDTEESSSGSNLTNPSQIEEISSSKFSSKDFFNFLKRIIFLDHNHQIWFSFLYLFDWLFAVILVTLAEVLFSSTFNISPVYIRYLPLDPTSPQTASLACGKNAECMSALQETLTGTNVNMGYPQTPSIIPFWVVIVLACPFNVSIFIAFQFYALIMRVFSKTKRMKYTPIHDLHHACLGLLEAMAMNHFFTNFFKVLAGRERPDFLSRLKNSHFNLKAGNVREGRVSFPSGHSSSAFCCMLYLSLYIAGKLKIFSSKGHSASIFGMILIAAPLFVAFCIAVSRTMDYHHNFSDITAGAIIGIFNAIVGYLMNYRSPTSKHSEAPKTRNSTSIFGRFFPKSSKKPKDPNNNNEETQAILSKHLKSPTKKHNIDNSNNFVLKRKIIVQENEEGNNESGAILPSNNNSNESNNNENHDYP